MKKCILAYVILWLPAVLVAYFYNDSTMLSHGLQWLTASVMILGWAITSGVTAYYYPRTQLSLIFFYVGLHTLLITLKYTVQSESAAGAFMRKWGGLLSYKPLGIFVRALYDFQIPHEAYVIGAFVVLCLIGYLVGLLFRRNNPNPYRPRIIGR